MSRHSFNAIFPLIHQHKVFKKEALGKKQYAVQLQLLVFLKRIGSEGVVGNSKKIANFLGISSGTVRNIIRVTKAILSLKDDVIMWPTASEREAMKTEIKVLYGFQNCKDPGPTSNLPQAGLARPTNFQAAGGSKNSLCRPPSEDFGC